MPNIKSARKRVLINEKKNMQNRANLSAMKTAIKKFNNAIDTNNIEEAERLLPVTISIIDATASKGSIHKNNAANKKSAISKRLNDIKTGKVVVVIKKDNKTIAAEKAKAAKDARDKIKAENLKKKEEAAAIKAKEEAERLEKEKAAKRAKSKTKSKLTGDEADKPAKKKAAPKEPASQETEETEA